MIDHYATQQRGLTARKMVLTFKIGLLPDLIPDYNNRKGRAPHPGGAEDPRLSKYILNIFLNTSVFLLSCFHLTT